jgi:predicted aconitase
MVLADEPTSTLGLTAAGLTATREHLSSATDGPISAVALGSPHFSENEIANLIDLIGPRTARVPIYVSTRPELVQALEQRQALHRLERQNVHFLAGTCVVVTPVLPTPPPTPDPVMTNSAKFAVYLPNNTGYPSAYGTIEECIESACTGEIRRLGSSTPE